MYDPAVARQVFNVGLSVTAVRNRDSQFKRSARLCKERMKKYIKNKELGLALVEAEIAAHKLDMANKYRTVGNKLQFISKQLAKAEAENSFDEDLKKITNLIDSAVRSMDVEKMQRAVGIYENYFLGVEDTVSEQGESKNSIGSIAKEPSKSKAEELLEKVIREVSRQGSDRSQPIVIPALAMNLAKKEKPIVEKIIQDYEQDKQNNPQIDLFASSLMRRSSLYLPEFEI